MNCGPVLLFQPGLWDAVDQDDIMSVRKLINLWCRADIKRVIKTKTGWPTFHGSVH